jgi:hypothetical protein
MNRRQLLFGLGTATGGAGLAFGTGAFTAAEVSGRQTDISVTNDAQSLIALVPNDDLQAVRLENGELVVGLDEHGVNQNSIYQFGYFAQNTSVQEQGTFPYTRSDPSTGNDFDSAFLIRNQTVSEQKLELNYELATEDDSDGDGFETQFWFEIHGDGGPIALIDTVGSHTATATLGSGEAIGVSFMLDVPDDTLGESIDGSLSITAGEAAADPGS